MSKYNPKDWNVKLAECLGYVHREDNVMMEMKGIDAGVEVFYKDPDTVLSKNKIVIDEYDDDGNTFRYLGRIEPSNPIDWDQGRLELWNGTIRWESENQGEFMYLTQWNPESNWNQFMKVVQKLGMVMVSSNHKKAYEDVCISIELKQRK